MKQIAVIISISLLMACGPEGNDAKKAELDSYRQKVEQYNQKIAELEIELEGEADDSAPISLIPVEIKKIAPENLSRYFEVIGSMEALKDAYISPEINGQIKKVAVKRGSRVRKGDLIIKLSTDVTEKSIEEVKTNLSLAEDIFRKQEELWKKNIGSEMQYLEAKNSVESIKARLATLNKQLEMAHATAPFAGIIDDIMVKEGELASPGMPMVHLLNLSTMRVSAKVSETYLNSVSKGDMVELRFSSYPEKTLLAPVTRLSEFIDQKTRTFILEVELDNPGELFKPNMLTSVRIKDYEEKSALVVPSNILRQDFQGTFLFLASEENESLKARKVYVNRGITVEDQTMITEGISVDDLVITKGFNLVGDGIAVRIVKQ